MIAFEAAPLIKPPALKVVPDFRTINRLAGVNSCEEIVGHAWREEKKGEMNEQTIRTIQLQYELGRSPKAWHQETGWAWALLLTSILSSLGVFTTPAYAYSSSQVRTRSSLLAMELIISAKWWAVLTRIV